MSENQEPEPKANITPGVPWRTMRLGYDGPDVVALQRILRALGLLAVVDGDFGPRTYAAVAAFQASHGLNTDRIVGPMTRAALLAAAPAEDPSGVEFDTAGPALEDHAPAFDPEGWYSRATRHRNHPGREGGAIKPVVFYVHTTDCRPGTFGVIAKRWQEEAGNGAGANFLLGKTPETGLIQMTPIYRNANHAGGSKLIGGKLVPFHGDYVINGKKVHPNLIANGLELDNAGRLKKNARGQWVHVDSGYVFDDADVYVDERGKGYERVTEYQFEVLGVLLDAWVRTTSPPPAGTTIAPNGDYPGNGAEWARVERYRIVGHATINPLNKTDPGPQVMDWIRSRY